MFDLTSSKLLILAVVALIVVGPKDFPALLRTIGRYMGMIRRQANEFRAQFDEAMRENWVVKNGCLEVPDRPGLGVDLNEEALLASPLRSGGGALDCFSADGSVRDV